MTNFGELPVWARPPAAPESSSKKRKDRKAAKQAEKAAAKDAAKSAKEAAASAAPSSEDRPPSGGPGRRSGRPAASTSTTVAGSSTASLGDLPPWAGGRPAAGTLAEAGADSSRSSAAAEPVVDEPTVVQLELDPSAPVHEEFGRLITSQQFSTKRIEVFEHAAVRIAGPLAPNPAFETLMSISFSRPEEKHRGRLGKIIEKTAAKGYQLLDEQQPMPETCLTIVTDVRTHEIHEAPPTPEGNTAGLLLVAAGELATASPADQAKVFAELLGIAAAPLAPHSVAATAGDTDEDAAGDDVELPDDTDDYSRERVVEMARGWAPTPPPALPLTPAPAWPESTPSAPAQSSTPSPSVDATPALGMVEPLVAEITRAVEEAASSLAAPLQPIPVPPAGTSAGMAGGRSAGRSPAERLRDLAELHRDGLISDAEFERKRQALLDQL